MATIEWEENYLVRWVNGLETLYPKGKEYIPEWITRQSSDNKVDIAEWDKLTQPIKE